MFLMRFTERAYLHYTAEDVKNYSGPGATGGETLVLACTHRGIVNYVARNSARARATHHPFCF